jgi:hypothetical protein
VRTMRIEHRWVVSAGIVSKLFFQKLGAFSVICGKRCG